MTSCECLKRSVHKKQPLNAVENIGENTTPKGSKHPIPHALPCTYTSQAREPSKGRGFRFWAGAAAPYLTLLLRLWPAPPQCSALAPHLSPCRAAARHSAASFHPPCAPWDPEGSMQPCCTHQGLCLPVQGVGCPRVCRA